MHETKNVPCTEKSILVIHPVYQYKTGDMRPFGGERLFLLSRNKRETLIILYK